VYDPAGKTSESPVVVLLELPLELLLVNWLISYYFNCTKITHDELELFLIPTANPTINPTKHNVTTSAMNASLRHPPLFAIIGLFRRLARYFSLSRSESLPLPLQLPSEDRDLYDNGDAIGFLADGGLAGSVRGIALGSGVIAKSCPSSEIAGKIAGESMSGRFECIVNMKAIAPDADYYRAGSV
jgi:hypothetical protein